MKNLPVIAGSQVELDCYLRANPWINPNAVARVTCPLDLLGHVGMVIALPAWEASPSIAHPRQILQTIAENGLQLVVLENAAYAFGGSKALGDNIQRAVDQHNTAARGGE